ncbi:FimV/HubP family polar landmark protein [uncultured Oceanisphaera sp.]|uniref:FimV/HubP family polar landmark protein n=1 Tax=uncultured Oceanisphaera sp. TaxID=353858 RepID=UPI002603A04E|nr:FimV/HubP family polar landmark protein [uncultured Oceanisphaera sp.]
MKRFRPHIGFGLAGWLACSVSAVAQGEFYIELRGPESSSSAPAAAAPVQPPVAQPVASPGRYGPVRSTDTLWAIAARYTRAPVTVQQTMVALYHLNPQAFVRGNINYLQRGARLRLPTESQARQRSPRDAEAEFRRLSRQGNRSATRAATAPKPVTTVSKPAAKPQAVAQVKPKATPATPVASKPAAPVTEPPPVAARPPVPSSEARPAAPAENTAAETPAAMPPESASSGLTTPKAATAPSVAAAPAMADPARAEEMALARLQLQLMDELREQVAMSNEQLANLADNNQALRQRLTRLTAEVEELKQDRTADAAPESVPSRAGISNELLSNPLNLALILTLPAMLLLALFTLWWRRRVRRELAEQEQEWSENSAAMMDDERNEFDELFAAESEPEPTAAGEPDAAPPVQEIDEDAFARFLEEQQLMEEQEAEHQQPAPEEVSEAGFDDDVALADTLNRAAAEDVAEDVLFEDEMAVDDKESAAQVSNDDIDDLLFEDEMAADDKESADQVSNDNIDDLLFEDEMAVDDKESADQASNDNIDDLLFNPEPAVSPEPASPRPAADNGFVSVDDLMAEADLSDESGRDFERKLDLELDDYADVLGQGQNVDIDLDEGGMGAQLDLARAYIEIDDIDSARELLNEALERGNAEQQRDAKKLLQRLAKR